VCLKIACLCPVIVGRNVDLLQNSLACFEQQTYPERLRRMYVLDDAGQLTHQTQANWSVWKMFRAQSLPHKYHALIAIDDGWADAFAVWDHDDVYLPDHLEAAANAMESVESLYGHSVTWCHPEWFYSSHPAMNGTQSLRIEPAVGRMHGSLVVRRSACASVGGWLGVMPPGHARRADFDQRMLRALDQHSETRLVRPLSERPTYVYRWATIQHYHCSGLMRSPEDETWYTNHLQRICEAGPLPKFGPLVAKPDDETASLIHRWYAEELLASPVA
jgi:hypothetical protein